jgi:hypothetical protein
MCFYKGSPVDINDRAFLCRLLKMKRKGRYVMKFLLIVLVLYHLIKWIGEKQKENEQGTTNGVDKIIIHPAEYLLR